MTKRISILRQDFFRYTIGLVFTLAFFVLHHAALQVQFLLVEHSQQMTHAIAFGEKRVVQHGCGDILKIMRAIVVGGAVEVGGADSLHGFDIGVIEVVAATEHQVLKKMGEARFAWLLVLRTHVVPGIHSHKGGFMVLMHEHGQPVAEHKLRVRNVWNRDVWAPNHRRRFMGWSRLRLSCGGTGVANQGCHEDKQSYRRCQVASQIASSRSPSGPQGSAQHSTQDRGLSSLQQAAQVFWLPLNISMKRFLPSLHYPNKWMTSL